MSIEELIRERKGDRSYESLARDCGGTPKAARIQQIAANGIKEFPEPANIRGLARGLGVPERVVLAAAAESLGFTVPLAPTKLEQWIPSDKVGGLTPKQIDLVLGLIDEIAPTDMSEEGSEEHVQRRSAPMKPQDAQWPDPPQYDDPNRFYEAWDNIAATELARRATNYIQIIAQGLAPDSDVKPDDVTAWLEVAFAAGMAREMADGIKDSVKIALPTVDHLPTSGPLRDWFILAAHSGTPAHGKDTRGEHSQDPDDYQP